MLRRRAADQLGIQNPGGICWPTCRVQISLTDQGGARRPTPETAAAFNLFLLAAAQILDGFSLEVQCFDPAFLCRLLAGLILSDHRSCLSNKK